ncbi:LysR family transcriptional regulator [Cognatishimia sp. F0-27]|uniref:LysR family transcriptional regulator n=1 Tax=Cognatishimia sp. F0-27 TaxID=2816855 RepID=UPI001D0C2348|nr:LysR family transcriptional regulator [Cognatishimia sp. F0-27]MCC1491065.1 LysR family transcriptional regulator [Cognatishimia sp. F0-27]
MDDLKPIRVFLEVAALSSFSKAARSLRMTPASVTRIIARLEEDLGQQLLVRTTRKVSLTTAGTAVATRYTPLLAAFDQATEELARANRPDHGRLRINAPLSMGVRLMPQLIESFRLAYPLVSVEVMLTDAFVDIIKEDCDLAIRISGPPADRSTIWRKICEVPRHAFAAPMLFERIPRPTRPEEIDPAHTLSYSSSGAAETWEFSKGTARRLVRAGSAVVSNNGDFLAEHARSGGGICVLPDFIVSRAVSEGALEPILTDWALPTLWLTLFYPPYEQLPPLVETFTDFFEAYIRDLDGLAFDTHGGGAARPR